MGVKHTLKIGQLGRSVISTGWRRRSLGCLSWHACLMVYQLG